MFGKLMSISDELMWRYFELLSFRPAADINALRASAKEGKNPRDIKFELALEIVARFHSDAAAEEAKQTFIDRFANHALPENLPVCELESDTNGLSIAYLLKQAGLVNSTSDAIRMIIAGAVRMDGERLTNPKQVIVSTDSHVYQVG